MPRPRPRHPLTTSTGIALVEVLVALCLGAAGFVGAVALTLHALRSTHEASVAIAAIDAAGDLAEALHGVADADTLAARAQHWRDAALAGLPPGAWVALESPPAGCRRAHLGWLRAGRPGVDVQLALPCPGPGT